VLTYATETTVVGANMPFTLDSGAGAGNLTQGLIASEPVQRLDYATETYYVANATELPIGSTHMAAVGTGIFT
jgi:hypothetical protein